MPTTDDHIDNDRQRAQRRLAVIASLAELCGGRGRIDSLVRQGEAWHLTVEGPEGLVHVELWGVSGAIAVRSMLQAAPRVALGEVSRTEKGLRLRMVWGGGLCDLLATEWRLT